MIALLANAGYLSETSRMIAIAQALNNRGVPTVVATHGGPYVHLIEEAGLQWESLPPAMGPSETEAFLDALLNLGRTPRPFHTDAFLREAVRAESAFFERVGARIAVVGFTLTAYLSSQIAGIPLATSHGGSFVPPVLKRGLCPAPVNPPSPGLARLPLPVQRWLVNRVPFWLQDPVRGLNRVAREFGIRELPGFMGLMCGDLTLVTDLPEILGIPRDELENTPFRFGHRGFWPRFRYVGPLYARLERSIPDRVQQFLSDPTPVVYVCPTSVRAPFLRALVPVVEAAGARVLVGATIHDVRDLESDRVMIEGVLPNHLIFPEVDAAVLMGGQGSVQTAMASGTPFVGMPYHGEQELNVALAERQGMALRLSPADASTSRMTDAVHRLLTEDTFRQNASRVRALYARADGAAAAANAILEFLGTHHSLKVSSSTMT